MRSVVRVYPGPPWVFRICECGLRICSSIPNPRSEIPNRNDAGWSSQVARWAHNPKVAGSNPVPATNIFQIWFCGLGFEISDLRFEIDNGDVAQLGEHLICIQGVAGSTPVISTNFIWDFKGKISGNEDLLNFVLVGSVKNERYCQV